MKKYFISLIVFFCFVTNSFSQNATSKIESLKQQVTSLNSGVDFKDKIILVCLWKSNDAESRELNKEAHRVYKIYEKAKLKNGEKGTVFISINLDDNSTNATFASGKDGIEPSTLYTDAALKTFIKNEYNLSNSQNTIVIDKTGSVQYTNMVKDEIFSSVRNLITR